MGNFISSDIVYSNEHGEMIDKLSMFGTELQQLLTQKIQNVSKQGDSVVLIYVIRACINYHGNPNGMSLPELDRYLTAFETNYKKHHKGKLPDSVSLIRRIILTCQRIL